jgi:large subunit ribosomal protein L29
MPILRMKEITSMSSEERTKKISELRAELSRLRTMISAGGAIENPMRVREIRRAIAQVLTVENEYKLGIRSIEKEGSEKAKQTKPKSAAAKKPKETQ